MKVTARDMAEGGCISTPNLTWLRKLKRRWFPYRTCPDPTFEGSTEMIVHKARVEFTFFGRMMIALGAKVEIETRIACEHVVGKTVSKSVTRVGPQSLL